ncbi:hypothetical protein ACO0K3_08905 [Undibacterium sp. Rencai35W]|uniref:hypothetical protein n=1 Tax=Undibacterium sp. Rencai35W TaxID=3413046 RepID=UPI003BF3E378
MIAYRFLVDLSIGGPTPPYQVISGDFHLPANTMPPLFNPGDSLQFEFIGRNTQACKLYARPLEASEEPAPFKDDQWSINLENGQVVTIGKRLGFWTFTIAGTYDAIITTGLLVKMPFLVDPECEVGSGIRA